MPLPKLLIVDDSATIRKSVQRLFDNAGYETIAACDGYEALECLVEDPALIVLDVNMPGLDGYGVCEKLREMGPKYDQLPIVFLTSVESRAMELLGREFGAYLNKPVQPEELLGVVEELLAEAQAANTTS
ncbi:MAG: response regulator [Planctomycetota bacterium]